VVLNAISMDRIIDRVTAELLAPGRLSAKAVAELLPDINEKFLSETSMRNADRRALTSGVGSETFRDTESGSSFRIELKLNGRNAELVEFTPGVTTRDDMGTMQNITASRATAESVRAAVGVGAT